MITLAALVLNLFHPGFCFPREEVAATHTKMLSQSSDVEIMSRRRSNNSSTADVKGSNNV